MKNEHVRYAGKQFLFIILLLVLAAVLFALGLVVGYGLIGGGENAWAILSPDKWQEFIGKFTGQ